MIAGLVILFTVALGLLLLLAAAIAARTLTRPPRRTAGFAVAHGEPTDPAEAGAPFTTHTLEPHRLADGPIDLWIVEGGDPAGPSLILVHGWADSRLGALNWLDILRPVACRLVLFDLRGHGDSAAKRFTWGDRELSDIESVVAHTGSLTPARPVIVLGWSVGAALAIEAAARLGAAKVGAVIADSPYRFARTVIAGTIGAQGLPQEPITTLALALLRLRGMKSIHADIAAAASRLAQPLLILHGADDPISPLEEARALAAAAPHATLEVIEGAGHIAACADPENYTAIVGRWIASRRPVLQSSA